MKKQLRGLVLASVSFILAGCSQAASQIDPAKQTPAAHDGAVAASSAQTAAAPRAGREGGATPQSNESQVKVVSRKANSKYGLSLLFLRSEVKDAPLNYVRLRNDKLGQDV
jgi:starvation-inducible outer membrane lipoprotein